MLAKYLYAKSSIHGKLGNEEKTIETFNESKAIVRNCSTNGDSRVSALQKMLDEVQPKITELEAKRKLNEPKSSKTPLLIGMTLAVAALVGF